MLLIRRVPLFLLAVFGLAACSPQAQRAPAPPAYFTQITDRGIRYAHNWTARPCFEFELAGRDWVLDKGSADRILWQRGGDRLQVYLTDNREAAFAVSGMSPEEALRAFIGFEMDYIKPLFQFEVTHPPRFAEDDNGLWAQWAWEGQGGKRHGAGSTEPADQRHVVTSLWLDPWVMSFDWATTEFVGDGGPTPEMIDVLDSLTFHPECFQAMKVGETREN